MSAGIEDVALRAGVSTATVSRALRGLPNVSAATRTRVLKAAEELDYVISPSASRLASGTTRSIGVVAPDIGRWFFGQVLSGIEGVLREAGYDVLLFTLPDPSAQDAFFADLPLRRRVDGVLVLTLPLTAEQDAALRALGLPIGTVGEAMVGLDNVGVDDTAAALSAIRHLINLGHTRIAMIGGGSSSATPFTTPVHRALGYRAAMAESDLPIAPGYEVDGGYTTEGGEAAMAELMSLPTPPTAVFAQSDEMAAGALKALRRMGLSCPHDVSIVGFDDHEIADIIDLTTVAQDVCEQGRIAAQQMLVAVAADGAGTAPVRRLLPTKLVLRGTTCPPRVGAPGTPVDSTTPTDSRSPAGHMPLRRLTTGEQE